MTKYELAQQIFNVLEDNDLINFSSCDTVVNVRDTAVHTIEKQLKDLIIIE